MVGCYQTMKPLTMANPVEQKKSYLSSGRCAIQLGNEKEKFNKFSTKKKISICEI
jgi:hypothetical protein